MKISTTQVDGISIVRIEGELRIATVSAARCELVATLAACEAMQIDLSEVSRCDTAGVQLLLMTCASARAKGKDFSLAAHAPPFRDALDRAGVPIECLESAQGFTQRTPRATESH